MRILKRTVSLIVVLIIILALVMAVKTAMYPFNKPPQTTAATPAFEPQHKALERLAGGLRIPTVSQLANTPAPNSFDDFLLYLQTAYPALYQNMETQTVNTYALAFCWPGQNRTLEPLLILSHYDVVGAEGYAAEPGEAIVFEPEGEPLPPITVRPQKWDYGPFDGAVANGRIYGRGTLDDKAQFFAILEAADMLIAEGFTPSRDIWFAFGFDEEIGGQQGAAHLAQFFKQQNLRFDAIIDEGGIITDLSLISKNATRPVGVAGVGEKGFMLVKITVKGPGGHSSMPPAKPANVLAAEIIAKLGKNQMPARLSEPIQEFLTLTGYELNYGARLAVANQWLLQGAILKMLGQVPAANALIRTTTAVTMVKGGEIPNVLSPTAEILVNFRLLPGDAAADVLKHVEDICKDYDVDIETLGASEATGLSPTNAHAFKAMENALLAIFPNGILSPYITVGATDASKYEGLSDNIYRLMPAYLNQHELALMHGVNEYISIANYGRMIHYYRQLMQNY